LAKQLLASASASARQSGERRSTGWQAVQHQA
jgi:hypothetical protein